MPEVYSSSETSLELLDPITGGVIMTIPFLRDDTFSESPTYAPRGYHRSAAVSAARLRSKGTITIRKDAESLAFAQEVERWQKGVIWYPMGSDLKGKRFRHPHVRKVMTQPDGTKEYRTGYDVRLSDRSLSRPDAGLLSESLTFDVQGGFDTSDSERGEPVRTLDFHRTGSATYVGTDGQIKTAGDGVARFGVPVAPVRRNLFDYSTDLLASYWEKLSLTVTAGMPDPFGGTGAFTLTEASGAGSRFLRRTITPSAAGKIYTLSYCLQAGARKWAYLSIFDESGSGNSANAYFNLEIGTLGTYSAPGGTLPTITSLGGGWYRCTVTFTHVSGYVRHQANIAAANGSNSYVGDGVSGIRAYGPMLNEGTAALPYQPTNATGVDLSHPLNGAGLVLEGAGTNLCINNVFNNTMGWSATRGVATTGALTAGKASAIKTTVTSQYDTIYTLLSAALTPGATYTVSFLVKTTIDMQLWFQNISLNTTHKDITLKANVPQEVVFSFVAGASGTWYGVKTAAPYAGDITIDCLQIEPGSIRTSLILTDGATVTRQPDLCGIVLPHNLLKWSEDFSNPAWVKSLVTIASSNVMWPNGVSNATQLTLSSLKQSLGNLAGKTVTWAFWARIPSGTANTLRVTLRDGATLKKQEVCNLTTTPQRFTVTYTFGATETDAIAEITSTTTAQTYEIWGAQPVIGSHPGIYVPTTDTPIPAPASPALDPALSQNGRTRFRLKTPSESNPNLEYVQLFGGEGRSVNGALLRLYRSNGTGSGDNTVYFDRLSNHATTISGAVGRGLLKVSPAAPLFSSAVRDVVLEWTNEINEATGVREMWQRIFVDGVLIAQQDVAALYGATAWAPIDPSRLISDGAVNAVLSMQPNGGGVIVEFPPRRAGYRQVERAA